MIISFTNQITVNNLNANLKNEPDQKGDVFIALSKYL